jgi:hypothetical protein
LPQIVGFWFERNEQHCFYAVHPNSTPQKYKAKQVNSRTSSKRYCRHTHTHTHTHTQHIHTLICVEMEALEAVEACGVKERVCERTASVVWALSTQRLRCQYLYICTSRASKLST